MAGEDDEDHLREAEEQLQAVGNEEEGEARTTGGRALNEVLSIFALQLKRELSDTNEAKEMHELQTSLVLQLLYYRPQVFVKAAVILLFVVGLTLLVVFEAHLMLTATWSLLGGLVVVSIISAEVAKRARCGQWETGEDFLPEWRCRSFEVVKSIMNENAGEYHGVGTVVMLTLFATFGGCSVLVVVDQATSLVFLVLFGVSGLVVVLLIGFQAWSKALGAESYIVVEALFDIVLASQLSANNAAEIAYNATTIALASVAVVCTLVRLYMRLNNMERETESIFLVAFLATDAADVVLLASQLFLSTSCDLDPKLLVVTGLLALNPCVSELSAAFKTERENTISRDIRWLLQDPERDENKLQALYENRFDEQAKRRRMENKSIVQTIIVGLGVFPIVYALSLVESETNWYWILIPIIGLIVYGMDSQISHYACSRTVLNKYFYSASFRLFSGMWALILVLTPVYAEIVNCNDSTAFIIWSLYSIVPLVVVTVIKSVQREEVLTAMAKEKYEEFVPKVLRPARADLASYYVEQLNVAFDGRKGHQRRVAATNIVKLFLSAVRTGRGKPLLISSLLDSMAYVVEYATDAVVVEDGELVQSASEFASLFWRYYLPYGLDDGADAANMSFQGALERVVTTLALKNDAEILKEVVGVVRTALETSCRDKVTFDRRVGNFASMLSARSGILVRVFGRYKHAEVLAEGALQIAREASEDKIGDETVARYLNRLALVLDDQGRFGEAEELWREGLNIHEEVLNKEHPEYGSHLGNLAHVLSAQGKMEGVEQIMRELVDLAKKNLGPEHPTVALRLNNLAQLLAGQGKLVEAEELMREVLRIDGNALGKEHRDYATGLNNLAGFLKDQEKLEDAEALYRQQMVILEKVVGKEHPSYALCLNNLGLLLRKMGKLDESIHLMRKAMGIFKKVHGKEHPDYALNLNNLAELLIDQGNLDEAKGMHEEALTIRRKQLGNEHPDVAQSLSNLGMLLQSQGKLDAAEPLFREALKISDGAYGNEHPEYALRLNNLGSLLSDQGKFNEAEALYRQALAIDRKLYGDEHPDVAIDLNNLAWLLSNQGDLDGALPLFHQAIAVNKKVYGEEHQKVAEDLNKLAVLLFDQDKNLEEADRLGKEALRIAEKTLGKDHSDTQQYRKDWG